MENKQEKIEEKKHEIKNIVETAKTEKVEEKAGKKKIEKKELAIINGLDLPISTKHSIYICDFIRGKRIDESVYLLEQVLSKKIFLPMRGEIPHRSKGQIGRYPEKATKAFIKLLKSLNANCQVNGIENPYISRAVPNQASRPYKRFGSQRFKRTHVFLEAREKIEKANKEEKK